MQGERVERRLGAMGTELRLEVEASSRAHALAASEAAVRALEACEARLSTWRDDSELARLNAAPLGEPFALSVALADELGRAAAVWRATEGAFDPAVGGLVRAWGLRTGGRRPSEAELEALRCPRGFAALDLVSSRATRTDARLCLEEGAFGKGAGLDAALAALREAGAKRALLDLGGQVALLAQAGDAPLAIGVAHPDRRDELVLELALAEGSLATSGNAERGIVVDGERLGHLLDPRSGRPAPDFGSLTVLAPRALEADALATGLYVLGPDAALAYAAAHEDVEVLVLERLPSQGAPASGAELRARASAGLAGRLHALRADLVAELPSPSPDPLR